MTLSPEDKARAVVRSLLEPLDLGKPYLETPFRTVMVEVIAAALREACNEKLEEAAAVCDDDDGYWDDVVRNGEYDSVWKSKSLAQAAEEIRALKSKDTTP